MTTSGIRITRAAVAMVGAALLPQLLQAQGYVYPATRHDGTVELHQGVAVADPFRWLEDDDAPEVKTWVDAQNALTRDVLAKMPGRAHIDHRLRELARSVTVSVPHAAAGRLFYTVDDGRQPQAVLYGVKDVRAAPEIAFDPNKVSTDGSVAYSGYSISPGGKWLAYSTSRGGADYASTHVRQLATGRETADTLRGVLGSPCWAGDEQGFFYIASPLPDRVGKDVAPRISKQLRYHVLGTPQSVDPLIGEWHDNYRWAWCMMSDDDRRLVVVAERGSGAEVYIIDGSAGTQSASAARLVRVLDHHHAPAPFALIGTTLYARTTHQAPRGSVIALDVSAPGASPRVIVPEPESGAIISRAAIAGEFVVLSVLQDVTSRILLVRLDGSVAGEVQLPGLGAVGWQLGGDGMTEVLFTYSSFLTPPTVYRYDIATGSMEPFLPPRLPWQPNNYEARQVFYTSRDGTRVPMFIVAGRDVRLDGNHPVMLTGYGGYGASFTPAFTPEIALWLELGGVYAVANIRGGGEYGEAWHRAGRLDQKQNSYDDFIAAAEYLIAQGWTRPERLAVQGHSNGGLLVGVMITQRPDLFAVAVGSAGHYDMLRYHRFTVGAGWIPEFGSPEDPTIYPVLRSYSPLHNVAAGTCFPATLLLAAEQDDRVVPAHAYKFAATLQNAQECEPPILLRVATDASHGYAPREARLAEWADKWTFVASRLGMSVPHPREPPDPQP